MSINRLIVAAAAFLIAAGALNGAAYADDYHYHSDFALHHCRDYGGVMTANGGCYVASKKMRKRLIYDQMAWDNAHRGEHEHHRHHDEFEHDY